MKSNKDKHIINILLDESSPQILQPQWAKPLTRKSTGSLTYQANPLQTPTPSQAPCTVARQIWNLLWAPPHHPQPPSWSRTSIWVISLY